MKILIEWDSTGHVIHKSKIDKTQNVDLILLRLKLFSTYVGEVFFGVKKGKMRINRSGYRENLSF